MDNALLWNHGLFIYARKPENAETAWRDAVFQYTTKIKWGEYVNGKEQDTSGKGGQDFPYELFQA